MSRERSRKQNRKSRENVPGKKGIERIGSKSSAAGKEGTLTPRLNALKTGSITSSRRTDSPRSIRSDRSRLSDSDNTTGHVISLLRRSSVISDKIEIDVRQEEREELERDLQEGALITPAGSNVDAWNSTVDPDEVHSTGWGSSYDPYIPQDNVSVTGPVDTQAKTSERTGQGVSKGKVETSKEATVQSVPEQIVEERQPDTEKQPTEQTSPAPYTSNDKFEERFQLVERERQALRSELIESAKVQTQELRAEFQRELLARKKEAEELRGLLATRAKEAISLVNYTVQLNKTVGSIKAGLTKVLQENKHRIGLLVEDNESLRKEIRELKESTVPNLGAISLTELETFPEGFLPTDADEQVSTDTPAQAHVKDTAIRDDQPKQEEPRSKPVNKPETVVGDSQPKEVSPKDKPENKSEGPKVPDKGVEESKSVKRVKPKANFS